MGDNFIYLIIAILYNSLEISLGGCNFAKAQCKYRERDTSLSWNLNVVAKQAFSPPGNNDSSQEIA